MPRPPATANAGGNAQAQTLQTATEGAVKGASPEGSQERSACTPNGEVCRPLEPPRTMRAHASLGPSDRSQLQGCQGGGTKPQAPEEGASAASTAPKVRMRQPTQRGPSAEPACARPAGRSRPPRRAEPVQPAGRREQRGNRLSSANGEHEPLYSARQARSARPKPLTGRYAHD